MTDTRWADVRTENGHQIIVLPADIRLNADRVFIQQDGSSGDITLRPKRPEGTLQDLMDLLNSVDVADDDMDAFMAERPMNRPVSFRSVFDDE